MFFATFASIDSGQSASGASPLAAFKTVRTVVLEAAGGGSFCRLTHPLFLHHLRLQLLFHLHHLFLQRLVIFDLLPHA